jgi:two-component system cell cycle sensor histidine kinase/response regulator CckA
LNRQRRIFRQKKNNNLLNRKNKKTLIRSLVNASLPPEQAGKRAEEEIRTLKKQIEFILGVTKTGLDIIDSEFNIRYIDPEWAKVYGTPTSKKCYEYFMGRNEICPGCGIPKALKTKTTTVTEEILVKEANRPIQVTTIPFQNSTGEWLVAEVNVDITERKRAEKALHRAYEELEIRVQERTAELARAIEALRADVIERKRSEEALRESEERYRTILENIEDGYYEVDLPGNFTFFNDSLCRMLGYSKDEMIGMGNQQYTDEENRKKLFQAFNKVYRTGEPTKGFGWEVVRKDGTKVFGEVSVSLIKDSKGEPIGFRGIARDITQRKRSEEALRTEKQRFQTLLENAPFGVVLIDKDGTFKYANAKFVELFGYDLNDVPNGKEWFRKAYPDASYRHNVISVWIEDTKLFKLGEKVPRIFTATCKDGSEKIICFITVQLETGENLISTEDITLLKRAEKEKAALEEQFRQSQRMEAIGRLAGGIAHDFNNLMTVIRGYSQLTLLELKEDNKLRENIEEVLRATQRATDLTRQLLVFGRRQIMDMKVLDLNTLLQDLDKMLRRVIGEDIQLVTILADGLGRVRTDPGQIEQVILNLAVNARDAMPTGGKLIIETSNAELDESYARSHVGVTPGSYVMFSMTDTGCGMSAEVKEHIFEPFFTTKEKAKGTGLGLSTVYGIVKQSGGNIWAYSELGTGATFKIYLPRANEPFKETRENALSEVIPRGTETILTVEDEEKVRKLAVEILKAQGYTVLEASHGEEAIKAAKEHGGEGVHLLLTDVVMPGMSGSELAKTLGSLLPKMKVLYMSGYTDNAIVHHGVLEEGVNYIQKPFTVDALARKVREVLDRKIEGGEIGR